jgi:hypothetical protein
MFEPTRSCVRAALALCLLAACGEEKPPAPDPARPAVQDPAAPAADAAVLPADAAGAILTYAGARGVV